MTNTYKYRGGRGYGVPAQVAGEEFDRIASKFGVLQPKDVVDEARPDDAPLHPAFEWNDFAAAEQFRQSQAREMIREIVVVRPEAPPINQFVSVRMAPEDQQEGFRPGYYRMADVIKNNGLYQSAIATLSTHLDAIQLSIDQIAKAAADEKIELQQKEKKAIESISHQIALASKAAEQLRDSGKRRSRHHEATA